MTHPYFDLPGPLILGHRGAAGVAPENTLLAFTRGLEDGAHCIESDVQMSREGVPILLHDPELERTTDGRGPAAARSLAELRKLDAAHFFEPPPSAGQTRSDERFPLRGQGIGIPTLEEAFEACPGARFNLEIKAESPELVRAVVALVREMGREERTLLTAGEDAIQALLRRELARSGARPALGAGTGDILTVVRAAVAGTRPETDSMAIQIPRSFGGQPLVTRKLIDHAHAYGIFVHVWTINEPDEMRELLDLGVDGIVTDFPGRLAELIAERAR